MDYPGDSPVQKPYITLGKTRVCVGRNIEISLSSERRNNARYRVPHFRWPGSREPGPYVTSLVFLQREWKETRSLEIKRLFRLPMAHEEIDPRDKVYALFGLMGEDDKNFIEPDYQIDSAKLFWIVAQANISDNI
jgi:hypothetical protein